MAPSILEENGALYAVVPLHVNVRQNIDYPTLKNANCQNKTYPPLSLEGYGRVLPSQNSVGSPGYSPGLWDIVCCAHSSVATLLCHLLHRNIRLCHHHRHRGLLYRAVCLGTLHL